MFFHLYSLQCLPFGVLCCVSSMGLFWLWPCVSFVFDVKAQFICIGCWPNSCVWLFFLVYCWLYLIIWCVLCVLYLIHVFWVVCCLLLFSRMWAEGWMEDGTKDENYKP
jgi:hypothetical protein